MTVDDLIKRLGKFDSSLDVVIVTHDGYKTTELFAYEIRVDRVDEDLILTNRLSPFGRDVLAIG